MEHMKIDGYRFYNMVMNGSNKLEEQKDFVNSLNVFPVPDGDTGTNMSMTFRSAVAEIQGMKDATIGEISKKLAKGALMGARGNSGVILSQIFRGIAKGFENKDEANAEDFAISLMEGTRSAYKAVMRPTEGTILTIIRAASESAVKSSQKDVTGLLREVCEHSKSMLDKTPEMLPVLKKAKVVDAGGMGLLIILQGMYEALSNNLENVSLQDVAVVKTEVEVNNVMEEDIKFGYCTEFFICSNTCDVEAFKDDLSKYGDSMVVVSDEDIVKVHIHTNEPGVVLTKALKIGEISKIKIENMREQHRNLLGIATDSEILESKDDVAFESQVEKKENAFISVAMGDGITNILKDLGIDIVIEGGQTMNPSTQDFVNAIDNLNAENIFILPNNKNIIMAASQAAELSEKNVMVIPSKTIPQGITALTVFNPEGNAEENAERMIEAIGMVSTGSVTYAVRDTETDNLTIKEGDILGLRESAIVRVGNDVYDVCEKLVCDMANEDSELITLFYGQDCDKDKVDELVERLEEKYEDMDIQCYCGNQPLYYFIVAVE